MERVTKQHVSAEHTLVDYGCGNMPYRELISPRIAKYIGCDLEGNSLADVEYSADGILPIAEGSVDLVLSTQVLEHVADPHAYLTEACRILKTGGKLLISTHGVWRYHPDPTDYWRWTCDGLRKQIQAAGFEIKSVEGIMGPMATSVQLFQDAFMRRLPRWMRKVFCLAMQLAMQFADYITSDEVRDRDACVFAVVAEKPG